MKEEYYRSLIKNYDSVSLTEGTESILNHLKSNNTPITIVTGSPKENVDFYFEIFALDKWFDRSKIVFDDGSLSGKPAPDIFLKAAKKLNLLPKECLVIEDSFLGLKAANNAELGWIMDIDPEGKNKKLFEEHNLCPDGIIRDFVDFDQVLSKINFENTEE